MDALAKTSHTPSNLLKDLLGQIDKAESVYDLLYQSTALLANHVGQHPEYVVRFTRLGELAKEYRPPMGSNEFIKLIPFVLSATMTGPACFVSAALDAYLYEIGNLVYAHQGLELPIKADASWYRPDMIKVITDVDPATCVKFGAAQKLQSLMDQVRFPWTSTESVPFEVFDAMLRDIREFVVDFEIAIQMRWPSLHLEGAV